MTYNEVIAAQEEIEMVQIKIYEFHSDEIDVKNRFVWKDAQVNNRQKNLFGENALAVLLSDYLCPLQPSFAEGPSYEIRFVNE